MVLAKCQNLSVLHVSIAVVVSVALISSYHGVKRVISGSASCGELLHNGRIEQQQWQATGCMMHHYKQSETIQCFKYENYWKKRPYIVFIGDSRIRQLYRGFVSVLAEEENLPPYVKHGDMHYQHEDSKSRVDFMWCPFADSTMVDIYKKWISQDVVYRPDLIVTGYATWIIKEFKASNEAFIGYKVNLTNILPYFSRLHPQTAVIWATQAPVVESRLYSTRAMITNAQVDRYNEAAKQILHGSHVQVWESLKQLGDAYQSLSYDGLHMSNDSVKVATQMLFNYYCNDNIQPRDGSCCMSPEEVSLLQIVCAGTFLLCLFLWAYLFYRHRRMTPVLPTAEVVEKNGTVSTPAKTQNEDLLTLFGALARLGLILLYFFLCDRANFFMKENKHFTWLHFGVPLIVFLILGIYFSAKVEKEGWMNREQSLEWRGWMQIGILVYHWTGASKILPIYMHMRVFVSSYLFMTGYGHFCFFFTKGSYSLRRLCQVLFRMNILVICLCIVMNRPYQAYYFVPLVSFWFVVIYAFMGMWPQVTAEKAKGSKLQYFYLFIKLVVLLAVISLLAVAPLVFEKIFQVPFIRGLFLYDFSLHEWHFRWELDRFSVTYGMIFAFILLHATHLQKFIPSIVTKIGLPLLGYLSVTGYEVFISQCTQKVDCNHVHTYITVFPIVGFVILRNLPWLGSWYSYLFTWVGEISLELFISQYHIWLARDTQGILVLIPGLTYVNFLFTTVIFVFIAHQIHNITGILTSYAVPQDNKLIIRNIVCFIMFLIPVAILRGGRSKKTSKLRVTGLCAGNSPATSEFPARKASNVENVSI